MKEAVKGATLETEAKYLRESIAEREAKLSKIATSIAVLEAQDSDLWEALEIERTA